MKHLEVVAAIIIYNNKILCARRPVGKFDYVSLKFEFPGGKVEPGENTKEALHRELIEEMDVNIDMDSMEFFHTVQYQYPDFFIRMHSFVCKTTNNKINLKEHVEIQWLSLDKLDSLDWAPADIPIVKKLMESEKI